MAKAHSTAQTTVTTIMREDGTVYFRYAGKTTNERLCQWTLAFLWSLVPAVIVAAVLWS
jgi:hypothetical protein